MLRTIDSLELAGLMACQSATEEVKASTGAEAAAPAAYRNYSRRVLSRCPVAASMESLSRRSAARSGSAGASRPTGPAPASIRRADGNWSEAVDLADRGLPAAASGDIW
ncbi:MAG: hypothetical protein E4H20_04490 [Spirochaetales bacterium]|nr:MAG: hypothetical protein E4H20_04490 [Spirochaetales bacterium]